MFVAMNRSKVRRCAEAAFETLWRRRDNSLKDVPGFVAFHLPMGPEAEDLPRPSATPPGAAAPRQGPVDRGSGSSSLGATTYELRSNHRQEERNGW